VSVPEENQQFAQVSHQQREFYLALGSVFALVRNIFFPAWSVRPLPDKLRIVSPECKAEIIPRKIVEQFTWSTSLIKCAGCGRCYKKLCHGGENSVIECNDGLGSQWIAESINARQLRAKLLWKSLSAYLVEAEKEI